MKSSKSDDSSQFRPDDRNYNVDREQAERAANKFLRDELFYGERTFAYLEERAVRQGVSGPDLRDAARRLGVEITIRDGGEFWFLQGPLNERGHLTEGLADLLDVGPKDDRRNIRNDARQAAIDALEAGLSVVPPKEDGSKKPLGKWAKYQAERATLDTIHAWYGTDATPRRSGCGLVCGAVSGNLEMFEFDSGGRLYEHYKSVARSMGFGELIDRLDRGFLERTPSGGYHWYYRCSVISGNTKLAVDEKFQTLIETRGEGGYSITAPSNGKVHLTGGSYVLLAGGFDTIPTITPEERQFLWDLARMMDETPAKSDKPDPWIIKGGPSRDGDITPWDDFNERASIGDVIGPHGWKLVFTGQDGTEYWRRPGKDESWSATFNHRGSGRFKCFTSSCPIPTDGTQTKSAVYAYLNHRGDFTKAGAALRKDGFGSTEKWEDKSSDRSKEDKQEQADQVLKNYKPKTFGVIEKAIGKLEHLWPNMLILGGTSMVWSKPKIGKTRLYIGLGNILYFAKPWPDGTKNVWPKGLKMLVCPYDRNHAEIANEMRLMEIPDGALLCPYDPRDDTGVSLVPLDDPFMIDIIRACLVGDPAIKLIVVDTLTYASGKSLSKPEDMKAILDGVMGLALQHHVALLLLIHENKEGEALGRRINERARVLMRLERYSEQDPKRLRLFVKEGNFPIKPAVTVVHTDKGVVFEPDQGATGNTADKRNACAKWLVEYLWAKGAGTVVDYGTLISAAGSAGFAGEQDENTGRWKNPNLLSRAIKAINDKDPALSEFHWATIGRDEETCQWRTKPIINYWLESNVPSPKDTDGTV